MPRMSRRGSPCTTRLTGSRPLRLPLCLERYGSARPPVVVPAGDPGSFRRVILRAGEGGGAGEGGHGARGDPLDLLGRPLELFVGEHGRALEREVAVQLEPGAASEVLVAHLDR